MHYTTVYDIAAQPPLNWRSLLIPAGLAIAACVFAYYARTTLTRYGLLSFGTIVLLLAVGIPYWDYYQLTHRNQLTVQGLVRNHWEKEWTRRVDNKNRRYSYEGFWVDTVSFGYFRTVDMAGFTNSAPNQYRIHDGLPVRIHYVAERQLDDGSINNRILKIEVVIE